jgi:hypothetical protein
MGLDTKTYLLTVSRNVTLTLTLTEVVESARTRMEHVLVNCDD